MARAKANKLYRTFVKGLITEAGYLTYPEDASSDELNTVISRKGNRTRRLGIDYEDGYVLIDLAVDEGQVVNEFVWIAADRTAGKNFLCLQNGSVVNFFLLGQGAVSDSLESFEVDLSEYKVANASNSDIYNNYAQFSAGHGFLFIVHPYTEPLCVEYDKDTNEITIVRVVVQIRDFEGVYDGLANDEEPSTLSSEHHYNLLNQGWVAPGTRSSTSGGGGTITESTYINPWTGEETPYSPGGPRQGLSSDEELP